MHSQAGEKLRQETPTAYSAFGFNLRAGVISPYNLSNLTCMWDGLKILPHK